MALPLHKVVEVDRVLRKKKARTTLKKPIREQLPIAGPSLVENIAANLYRRRVGE